MTMTFLSSQISLNILLRPILFNSYFTVVVFLCCSVLPRFYETKDTETLRLNNVTLALND